MENSPDPERRLIAAVSHDLVRQFAPEELPLFADLVQDYFANPTPPQTQTKRDDPLGFGLEAALTAIAPAAAAMTGAAIHYVVFELAADLFKDHAKDKLKDRIAALFNRTGPAALNPAQMAQVRQVAVRRAVDFGVDPKQAELMADAMIGSLALPSK